jgi:hypothetical protein
LPEIKVPNATMFRMIWLTLFCLAAVGCLTVVRWIATPAVSARPSPVAVVSDGTPAAAKGDRLPPHVDNGTLRQAGLDALKKAAALSASSKRESTSDDVVSWHWREGSKVVRQRQSQ